MQRCLRPISMTGSAGILRQAHVPHIYILPGRSKIMVLSAALSGLEKIGAKMPSSVQVRGLALIDSTLSFREAIMASPPIYSYSHGDTEIHFPLCDARSFIYLNNCIKNGVVTHEQIPVDYFAVENIDLAIDIGAHFGVYSALLASLTDAPVISFEPNIYNASILQQVLNKNGGGIVDVRPVSDTSKDIMFYQGDNVSSNDHTLYPEDSSKNPSKTRKHTVPISEIINRRGISRIFIKIDAEGAEPDILRDLFSNTELDKIEGIVEIHTTRLDKGKDEILKILEEYNCFTELIKENRSNPGYYFIK